MFLCLFYFTYLIVEREYINLVPIVRRESVYDGLRALAVQRAPLRLPHAPAERVHHYFGRATAAAVQLEKYILFFSTFLFI